MTLKGVKMMMMMMIITQRSDGWPLYLQVVMCKKQKLDKMRINFVVLLGLVLLNGLWLG